MIQEHIKAILQYGSSVSTSYKSKIGSWYSEIKLSPIHSDEDEENNTLYYISPYGKSYKDIDTAIQLYCFLAFTSNNVGYVQQRLTSKKMIEDVDDDDTFLKPSKAIKKLFTDESNKVDEEAKLQGIFDPRVHYNANEVIKAFKAVCKDATEDNLKEKLAPLLKTYEHMIDRISLYAFLSTGKDDNHTYTTSNGSINMKWLKELKSNTEMKKYLYLYSELLLHIDMKIERIQLNF